MRCSVCDHRATALISVLEIAAKAIETARTGDRDFPCVEVAQRLIEDVQLINSAWDATCEGEPIITHDLIMQVNSRVMHGVTFFESATDPDNVKAIDEAKRLLGEAITDLTLKPRCRSYTEYVPKEGGGDRAVRMVIADDPDRPYAVRVLEGADLQKELDRQHQARLQRVGA